MATKNNEAVIRRTEKVHLVGDSMSGKRTLLFALEHNQFMPEYYSIFFETYIAPIYVNGQIVNLAIYNIAGLEGEYYDRLRALSYPDTSIVLICFSVDDPISAKNVIDKWTPEVRHYCGQCPLILVACKKDLRTDPQLLARLKERDEKTITNEVGRQIAAQIKADTYMECSAKTGEGVQDLFIHAARLTLRKRSHRTIKCKCILQ